MLNDVTVQIFLLWLALTALSILYGYYISLHPPEQKDNPIAVFWGIAFTIILLSPSQYLAYQAGLTLLFSLMLPGYFITSLGIVGAMWSLKHRAEEVSARGHQILNELNERG